MGNWTKDTTTVSPPIASVAMRAYLVRGRILVVLIINMGITANPASVRQSMALVKMTTTNVPFSLQVPAKWFHCAANGLHDSMCHKNMMRYIRFERSRQLCT